jgi:SSS family solute:Na+ symporter
MPPEQIQVLYAATILTILNSILLIAVSLATPAPPSEQVYELVWTPALLREESRELAEKPWYWNYRYWSIALLAVIAVIVVIFF